MKGIVSLVQAILVLYFIFSVYFGTCFIQAKIVWLWHEWFIPELRTCYWRNRRKFKRFKRRFDATWQELKYLWKII